MKKYIIVLLCWLLAVFLIACSGEVQAPPVVIKQLPKAEKKQPTPSKLNEKQNKEWPYIESDSDDSTGISENLTRKNYLLIFDGSGSMGEIECGAGRPKITAAKEAVAEWANSLPKDANLGLVSFYDNKWASLPLKPGSRIGFMQALQKTFASGRTPLTEALLRAFTSITAEGKKQLGYGDYTIVVVTDGIANNGTALSAAVKNVLAKSPVNIYTIGFCIGQNHSLNQPGLTVYKSADNPAELKRGLSEVLAESDTFDEGGFE